LNTRVQSDEPVFRAAPRHDGRAPRCRAILRLAGDSPSAIRCYNEWTYFKPSYLPRLVLGILRELASAVGVLQRSFRMPVSRFVLPIFIVFGGSMVHVRRRWWQVPGPPLGRAPKTQGAGRAGSQKKRNQKRRVWGGCKRGLEADRPDLLKLGKFCANDNFNCGGPSGNQLRRLSGLRLS
jgi:hypothetical protein